MLIVNSVCTSKNQQQPFITMTDSMKFGPEWLRNLSSEGNTSTVSAGGTRYHLAEHRYGREEMLALFEQSLKLRPPASMSNFKTLYVEQALNPLALAPMTEDETRLWSTRTVPPGALRGRGGSMDRGRGRGRGGTFHPGFSRSNSAYGEETPRPFDRSQSDRAWSERNGDLGDWGNSSTSPRKDYSNSRGAISNDWRRHRNLDESNTDADGWRANNNHRATSIQDNSRELKWGASGASSVGTVVPMRSISGNWRDGDSRADDQLSDRQATNRISWHSGDSNRNPSQRKMFDPLDDHLPEWATENPSEAGGSFDASGAFHGSDADDEFLIDKGLKYNSGSVSSNTNSSHSNTLQKSASQQNLTPPNVKKQLNSLCTSQSATNLMKKQPEEHVQKEQIKEPKQKVKSDIKTNEDKTVIKEIPKNNIKETTQENLPSPINKKNDTDDVQETIEIQKKMLQKQNNGNNKISFDSQQMQIIKKKIDVDEFDHMKEVTDDIVAKLILDDEIQPSIKTVDSSQQRSVKNNNAGGVASYTTGLSNVMGSSAPSQLPPPPGSGVLNDKWYYRDPQGEVQGPFTAQEMSDWFRAGYFTVQLLVRRHIDERYFTLGDLVKQCPGNIPFLTCRLPPLKPEITSYGKLPTGPELNDSVQQMHMQRLLQRHAETIRTLSQTEPWNAMSHIQQRELVTQHMMQQPQVLSDLPFIPPISNTQMSNPLMHMISQMQQANKLPHQQSIVEKQQNNLNNQHLDPLQQLVQQMGGMQSNISPQMPMQQSIQVQPSQDTQKNDDPIQSLLRQLANQTPTQRGDWNWNIRQPQQQQSVPPSQPNTQWLNQQLVNVASAAPIPTHSMWDIHTPQSNVSQQIPMPPSSMPPANLHNNLIANVETKDSTSMLLEEQKKKAELEKEQKQKERKEQLEREKRKKEQEHMDKLKQQKELEDKRKEEHKKLEAIKKAEIEKVKKEEEKIRKELEKVKREAEEKRLRELEEKRKLKEQRKAEEENRKKLEEERKQQLDEENKKKEQEKQREEQTRRQAEALRKMQEQQQRIKVAPWCQSSSQGPQTTSTNLSLTEIQRAEREKRATETAQLLQQQKTMAAAIAKETQEQQAAILTEKNATMQLKWATKKPITPKKIKSLAEIQAEEQERVAKQLAEQRLAQQQKEKELPPITNVASTSIWNSASHSLTWNTSSSTPPQSGFWDETTPTATTVAVAPAALLSNKQIKANSLNSSNVSVVAAANNTTNSFNNINNNQMLFNNNYNKTSQQPKPPIKNRVKKEEENIRKLFDKNPANNDEFTTWCMKTLATLNSDVDIPTFVGFLFDIESPYEIKDYVRQYLGDSTQALHFANQFVERRSKMKNLERAALQHKDDLCMPAPAINPSVEFQEVKGKGKKTKKSKMTKVDNRILGFSVTAAENRINVGDRDYGDNV